LFNERRRNHGNQTLALVVLTGMIGLAAVLLALMKHRTPAVNQRVRNDQSVLDTWENEGGNAE
jgi:hypothetical protein